MLNYAFGNLLADDIKIDRLEREGHRSDRTSLSTWWLASRRTMFRSVDWSVGNLVVLVKTTDVRRATEPAESGDQCLASDLRSPVAVLQSLFVLNHVRMDNVFSPSARRWCLLVIHCLDKRRDMQRTEVLNCGLVVGILAFTIISSIDWFAWSSNDPPPAS